MHNSPQGRAFIRGKGITDGIWYTLCGVLVLLGIIARQPLLVVVGILLLLIIITTDIWSHYCLVDLRYQRKFSQQRALFGEDVTMSVTVENAKILPLPWLEVEDTLPRSLPLREQELRSAILSNNALLECLFSPRWYERVTRNYTLRCIQRGVHTFGPTRLHSGDAFGFIAQDQELDNLQHVMVYPLVAPLESFNLPARHPFGDQRAPRRLLEDPSRIIGVREYRYGDSMRRVHWKATARSMQMQSKIYDATTTYTLEVFLNIDTRPDVYYSIHPELQELSISLAASIASWGLDNGYGVGLYANTMMYIPDEKRADTSSSSTGQQEQPALNLEAEVAQQLNRRRIRLPASSNEEQRKHIMETLARIQGYFGASIDEVLQAESNRLPNGSTIILITSNLGDRIIDRLAQMRRRGHAISVLFVNDNPPPARVGGINVYHIGGEERWQELIAPFTPSNTAGEQEPVEPGAPRPLPAVPSLHL
ncbi:hypothetical protein KSC_083680 [Ktedonobacter sp. SOSP1-52]|uniref:DUF58 domain-containing protein n=1 Tax=Ktedonobacter sp. SOSP1-52 TaxID=2778366 RepID=UPI0019160AF2|nr:DUF58 domain-containing protein [Ktedonobacter sp. SOSP1-52]GHO69476.1 hypothetical protein KSC_083680 [Ktedonobacter sp. SOSP1-52]